MTILLLLELSIADRVAGDYAEFLTYKILVTDVAACAPLLFLILSPSPSALLPFSRALPLDCSALKLI